MSKAEMMPEKDFQARARLPDTENPVKMTGKLELADAGGFNFAVIFGFPG